MNNPDPASVYRDATYSAGTQKLLRQLLAALNTPWGRVVATREEVAALRDVIVRWDENEATETVLT